MTEETPPEVAGAAVDPTAVQPTEPAADAQAPAADDLVEHPDVLRLGDEGPVHPSKQPVASRPTPAGPEHKHRHG